MTNLQYGFCRQLNLKNYKNLIERIKKNEGFRVSAYKDILGFKTIGYGHLIKSNEEFLLNKKFNRTYLTKLFNQDFNKSINDYLKYYKDKKHNQRTKNVIIEMIFQLGIYKQRKFVKMNKYIEKKQFFMAALEMKNSLWYKQTPKRVNLLINILLQKKNEK